LKKWRKYEKNDEEIERKRKMGEKIKNKKNRGKNKK